jgi:toxin ParE1/3/4
MPSLPQIMSRYTVSPQARRDLREITRYIAQDKPFAAVRLRDLLHREFRLLATNPRMGEALPDLGPDLRMFCVGNYVILFRPKQSGIAVARVIHGARDLGALVGGDQGPGPRAAVW